MPRDGNSVYSLPVGYLAVVGEDILPTNHNPPLEDLAADANTPRPIAVGGTGATTASGARTALGIGTNVMYGFVPIGGIILWSGSIASIPANWALCDGTNGTPNLRDRFVVGAGTTYAVGDTGGAATVALTTAQLAAHSHTGTALAAGAHSHTITHGSTGGGGSPTLSGGSAGTVATYSATDATGDHVHTLAINNAGSGQAHENRPPYYALAYIMRVS